MKTNRTSYSLLKMKGVFIKFMFDYMVGSVYL